MLFDAGWTGSKRLRAVTAGEALPWALALKLFHATHTAWNAYGPTEATVYAAYWKIDGKRGSASLGRSPANVELYVLDDNLQLLPIGSTGELYIGGAGVARGYVGRPYKTGDWVRWGLDGTLEFLERRDLQVKLRGYRVELGEIEAVMLRHPSVSSCAVVVDRAFAGERLLGYYVARSGKAIEPSELREHSRRMLPDYMLPAFLIPIPSLPLTANGKTDRNALEALGVQFMERTTFSASECHFEQALADIWGNVLGLAGNDVDRQRTFFDLGGTSLQLAIVQRLVHERLGFDVAVGDIFSYPSVSELAAFLRDLRGGPSEPEAKASLQTEPGTSAGDEAPSVFAEDAPEMSIDDARKYIERQYELESNA
jgi:hypothetical protein